MAEDPLTPYKDELVPIVSQIVQARQRQEAAKKILDEEKAPIVKRIELLEEHAEALRNRLHKDFSENERIEEEARKEIEEALTVKKTIECKAYVPIFEERAPQNPFEAYYYLQALVMGKIPENQDQFPVFGFDPQFLYGLLPIKKYSKVGEIKVLGIKARDTERRVGSYFVWFGYLACLGNDIVGFMGFRNNGNRIKEIEYWVGGIDNTTKVSGEHVSKPLRQFKTALKKEFPDHDLDSA